LLGTAAASVAERFGSRKTSLPPGGDPSALEIIAEVMTIFRLSQTTDPLGTTIVNIDGELVGEYVPATENCCSQALSLGTPVSVFLRDVTTIDESGRNMLRRLVRKGVRLLASGVYTSHLVETLKHAALVERLAANQRDP
jgi:hypothetical protein